MPARVELVSFPLAVDTKTHKIRDFQLEVCAYVQYCVEEGSVQALKRAVAVAKAQGGLMILSPNCRFLIWVVHGSPGTMDEA